jgi:hypothetical protein
VVRPRCVVRFARLFPLKATSGRLRHSSIQITADQYQSVTPDSDEQAANLIAGVILS